MTPAIHPTLNAILNAILVSLIYAGVTHWGQDASTLLDFASISQLVFFFVIAIFMAHLAQEAREEAYGKRAAQEALRVKSGELDHSTEQLKQAREALRANDRLATLGMFSAGVTHELKNPLNVMAMYGETLLGEEGASESFRVEASNVIQDEVERLATLISTLLSIARIEAGAVTVQRQRVRLQDFIADVVDAVSRSG